MTPLHGIDLEDSRIDLTGVATTFHRVSWHSSDVGAQGPTFVQNFTIGNSLSPILTGMRTGEIGVLNIDQIKTDDVYYYFDLRPFDPRKGRVARCPGGHHRRL